MHVFKICLFYFPTACVLPQNYNSGTLKTKQICVARIVEIKSIKYCKVFETIVLDRAANLQPMGTGPEDLLELRFTALAPGSALSTKVRGIVERKSPEDSD